jgi:hypothetical protein
LVEGREEDVLAALGRVDGVRSVSVVDRRTPGTLYAVTSSGGAELNPKLAAAIARGGWSLHELMPRTMSLEDLFVRILEEADSGGRS